MNKIEADFTTSFQKWVRYNYSLFKLKLPNCLFEVKVIKEKNAMCFKTYVLGKREHQLCTTYNLSKGGSFVYKFSDFAQLGTPCDGIILTNAKGIYILNWYGDKEFYIIDSVDIKNMIDRGATHITKTEAFHLSLIKGCVLK